MIKKELRKKYKAKRKELTIERIDDLSLEIANHLIPLDIWDATYFHLFLPIEEHKEVNTEYILQILHAKDKEVVVSKSDFKTLQMTHYLLTDNTAIKKNQYNIPEPVDGIEVPTTKINVVFVPLLAFDDNGNRVGYGKGFYDQFLKGCESNCLKIGLSVFEVEEELIDDVFENDIPLDLCVTPKKVYRF